MAANITRKSAALAAFLLMAAAATAASTKATLTTDQVWSGSAEINGPTVVPKGVTLTIEPGTVIEIQGYWDAKLIVQGRLHAVGTKERPIRFDVGADNAYWSGIAFHGVEATGRVERCEFKNGRRVTITCEGASPVIRNNAFVFRVYGGGGVLCQNGSRARVEDNEMSGGGGAAVLVVNAAPTVVANRFKGFAVGVQVSARTAAWTRDAEGKVARAQAAPVAAEVRPTCKQNRCDGPLEFFDERVAGGKQWKQVFASEVIAMGLRRIEVQGAKGGDTLCLMTLDARGTSTSMKRHALRLIEGKFVLKRQTVDMDVPPDVWRKKWPERGSLSAEIDGRACRLMAVRTVLGQLWLEGCNDTKPAHILLSCQREKDGAPASDRLLWASPEQARGHLLPAVADFDGDGKVEIVVATKRWCEGKGQILVFQRQQDERVPE